VLLAMGWRAKDLAVGEAVVMALVVGLSVFVWRSAGNVAELNDDPPSQLGWFENRWFSPNDCCARSSPTCSSGSTPLSARRPIRRGGPSPAPCSWR